MTDTAGGGEHRGGIYSTLIIIVILVLGLVLYLNRTAGDGSPSEDIQFESLELE